jgi:hypothetical protein
VGALGPVFRTYEPTRDRLVAVKVFRLDITPEQAHALADELARAADAGLFYSSIVEPIAAGVEGTVAYRAEEYVAAESLDIAMRHHAPAPLDKVLPYVTQLAAAIDFARAAGVGHGALHPRDVFLTPDEARASGFGIVDALERVGLRAPVRRPYSAPERIAGSTWGTPADVFSLAAIAFELLTGRRPSGTGADIGPLTGATVEDPERIHAVLARAMDEDPDRRFRTAQEFTHALDDASGVAASGELPPALVASGAAIPATIEEPVFADEEVPGEGEVETERADDIDAEREEDAAHWALTQEETAAAEQSEILDTSPFAAPEVEAAADALTFDAAELALNTEDRFNADSFADAAPVRDLEGTRAYEADAVDAESPTEEAVRFEPVMFEAQRPRREEVAVSKAPKEGLSDPYERVPFESMAAAPERLPPAMLPLALTLILGVLLGFLGGWVVLGRRDAPPRSTAVNAGEPPRASDADAQNRPAGTLGTTREPEAPRPSSRPSTTPPPVAPESPSETPATRGREAAAAVARTGKVFVRSTPPGAAVTINGRWRGRTPLPLDRLPFGKYTVRVVQPGFKTAHEDITLTAEDASRTVSFQLERDAAASQKPAVAPERPAPVPAPAAAPPSTATSGIIDIDSRPSGARVFVDGRPLGTTPLRVPEVTPGAHQIRLELPNFQAWVFTAQVSAGKTTRVAGSLEPIR